VSIVSQFRIQSPQGRLLRKTRRPGQVTAGVKSRPGTSSRHPAAAKVFGLEHLEARLMLDAAPPGTGVWPHPKNDPIFAKKNTCKVMNLVPDSGGDDDRHRGAANGMSPTHMGITAFPPTDANVLDSQRA